MARGPIILKLIFFFSLLSLSVFQSFLPLFHLHLPWSLYLHTHSIYSENFLFVSLSFCHWYLCFVCPTSPANLCQNRGHGAVFKHWNTNTAHIAWDYNLRLLGGVLNNKKKERSLHFPLFHFWNLTGSKFKELAYLPSALQETIPLGLSGTTGFIIHSQTAREIKGNFKLTRKAVKSLSYEISVCFM